MTRLRALLLRTYRLVMLKLVGGNGAYQAGLRYYQRGDYETALEAFRDSEGMYSMTQGPHPHLWNALSLHAWCYVKLGHPEKALPLIERAIVEYRHGSRDGPTLLSLEQQLEITRSAMDRSD
jgi:tetratricopeptide (TPR) repeat protein